MNINTIKALVFKELKQIKRDASSILVAFIMPLTLLIIYGYGLSFDIKHIRIDIVQQDSGKLSKDLINLYTNSEYFKTNIVYSTQEAKGNMESGKTMGTIIIPQEFSEKIQRHEKTEIQVISDGTDPNTAAYIESYASGLFNQYLLSLNSNIKDKTMNVINRLWFNPTTDTINFMMAGALTMILAIVATFLTSLVVAKEWERGTMEAMIATPISINEIIISKVIPYFGLSIISLIFSLVYAKIAFNLPFEGSIFSMALVSSAFIIVSLITGLIVSTTSKNQFIASMMTAMITFLPTMMLSGAVFEIKSMPIWLQAFSYIFPAKYYVSSARTICLVGDIWPVILRDTIVLSLMALGLLQFLKKKLRKNVE